MEPAPITRKRREPGLYMFGLVLLIAAAAGVTWFSYARYIKVASARTAIAGELALGPRVEVVPVTAGPTTRTINLLGDVRPYLSATLFAKVSGYIKTVSVDKGDTVHAGDVLAVIDSAETDSLYDSAVADMNYKERLAERDRQLLRTGNVAPQTAEQAEASLRMAQELVRNTATMKSYELLRAPFDGTVTGRFADPGALMQAALTNQSSSLPVVTISDNSKLRVSVYVEQRDVAAVHIGDPAEVTDASNPDRHVAAKVSRTTGMLDPRTRTLDVEIDVDNRDGFLVPGSFAYVKLSVPIQSFPQIPVAALMQRNGTQMVALVRDDGSTSFRPIKVTSTDGAVINVADGVKPGDRVALHVPDDVVEGNHVRPVVASR